MDVNIDDNGNAILEIGYSLSLLGRIGFDIIGVTKDTIASFIDFNQFPNEVEVSIVNVSKHRTRINIQNYAKIEKEGNRKRFTAREIYFGKGNLPDVPFSINSIANRVTIAFPDGYKEESYSTEKVPEISHTIS